MLGLCSKFNKADMHKANDIRKDLPMYAERLALRGYGLDVAAMTALFLEHKDKSRRVENLRTQRNETAAQFKRVMAGDDSTAKSVLQSKIFTIQRDLPQAEAAFDAVNQRLEKALMFIPNLPHASVPVGEDEASNVEVYRWIPRRGYVGCDVVPAAPAYLPKDHVTLGDRLGLDMTLATRMSGSRFAFMRGPIATLHRALAQFMMDVHTQTNGYVECYTPYMVDASALMGTGQLPKFEDDMFKVERAGRAAQYLIPTAEIPLTNSVAGQMLAAEDLPIKLVAHTPCFRSEAGSAGRDTRGLIRQHQFDKVEMVQIVSPSESYKALEEMLDHAEHILQLLELPYRVVRLCTGDMGFSAAMTYDLEVWMPSQNTWREISSVSNCEGFQANRMNTRIKVDGVSVPVHTLNGSGVAVGRALVAVLENHQTADGSVRIPDALVSRCFLPKIISPQ